MGIFDTRYTANEGMDMSLENPNELLEAYIFEELNKLSDEDKKLFCASEEAKVMEEKGLISRKTIVRLNKNDDLSRRTKMAAFQAAKEKGDPLWDKLVKNRKKERELIAAISKKYANVAARNAKMGQRDFLKKKIPAAFLRPDLKEQDKD